VNEILESTYEDCFKKFLCGWAAGCVALALVDSRLYPIDHKARHCVEEFPKDLLGLYWQRSLPKSTTHQAHPSVAGSLIYVERRMPRAKARMASLFDVSLRPPEPTDQEISEALLSTREILRWVHGSQKVVLRDQSIEGGDQARETFRANHGMNFDFLHCLTPLVPVATCHTAGLVPSSNEEHRNVPAGETKRLTLD
jgi:hypothetical protein